jgi:hypothetical protein
VRVKAVFIGGGMTKIDGLNAHDSIARSQSAPTKSASLKQIRLIDAKQLLAKLNHGYSAELRAVARSNVSLKDEYTSQRTPDAKAYFVARKLEQIIPIELTDTDYSKSAGLYDFGDKEVSYLARTLTNRGKKPDPSAQPAVSNKESDSQDASITMRALAEAEFKLLKNSEERFDIVITPATLIKPSVPINLISVRPDRKEWFGLPSVVYAVPTQSNSESTRLSPKPDSETYARKSFSHFQSFASNKAFGRDKNELNSFSAMQKESTPAQAIDVLRQNTHGRSLVKPLDPNHLEQIKSERGDAFEKDVFESDTTLENLGDFSDKVETWAGALSQVNGEGRVPHNEVAIRLWPWDITHVAMAEISDALIKEGGSNVEQELLGQALEVTVSMACQRYQLASEFLTTGVEGKGTSHPVFLDWLVHQNSVDPETSIARTRAELDVALSKITEAEKETALIDLCSKLLEKVSLVDYSAGVNGFKAPDQIKNMPFDTFYKFALMANSYMNHLSAEEIEPIRRAAEGA